MMAIHWRSRVRNTGVVRPQSVETTALGAATMAGLAEGVWGSLDDLSALWSAEAAFTPELDPALAELAHAAWTRSVERARGWAVGHDPE